MSIRVLLPNAFQKHTAGAREHSSDAAHLDALLDDLSATYPALATHIRDDKGQLRGFLNIYVNEEDIRFLGLSDYRFQDGDEVLLIPSIAGGSTGAPPHYSSARRSCACGSGSCRCCPANRCCTPTCCCCSDTSGRS